MHLAAGEGGDDRNVFKCLGTANDVLKYGLPREAGQIQVNYALIRLAMRELLLNSRKC
jgi:hypothetical protein